MSHLRISCGVADCPDGFDDAWIGAAPAQIAAHSLTDLGIGCGGLFVFQQGHCRHDLPGRAVAALKAVMLDEGFLDRMEGFRCPKTLDRGDLGVLVHYRQGQAGIDAAAIHQNGAGAALAFVAALLGAGQPQTVPQGVKQGHARFDTQMVAFAVDGQRDRHGRIQPSHPAAPIQDCPSQLLPIFALGEEIRRQALNVYFLECFLKFQSENGKMCPQ